MPTEPDLSTPMVEQVEASEAVSLEARRRIGYIPELDGLRGVGASFVVLYHLAIGFLETGNEIRGTFVFMDMFFVLSGFLITALLLREKSSTNKIRLTSFYRRRAMRLLPALYFFLAAHAVYAWFNHYPWTVEKNSLFHAAFYGLNFQMTGLFAPVSRGMTQLWSLGVEEQFYLIWPLVVISLLALRRRLGAIVVVLVIVIAFVVIRRYYLWDDSMTTTTRWMRLYTHTDTRADSLLIGALLGFLWVHGRIPAAKVIKIAAWLALPVLVWFLLFVDLSYPFAYQGGLTLMAIAWAFVILACVETNWSGGRVLRFGPLRALGEVSYGIYVWHVFAQWIIIDHLTGWPLLVKATAALSLTAVMVLVSWFVVERPFLQWKARIDSRQLAAERRAPEPA